MTNTKSTEFSSFCEQLTNKYTMADEDISLTEDQLLETLDDPNNGDSEFLNEVCILTRCISLIRLNLIKCDAGLGKGGFCCCYDEKWL